MIAPAFLSEWRTLSARIGGFKEAFDIYLRALSLSHIRTSVGGPSLNAILANIVTDIVQFTKKHSQDLPAEALVPLRSVGRPTPVALMHACDNSRPYTPDILLRTATQIIAMRGEVDHFLTRGEVSIRALTDRSFLHLQRLVSVDHDVRSKWEEAFGQGEVRCEQLGSTHLLWHGIYAFKVSAKGEQTDLVFQDGIDETTARSAAGLVLTEWKVLRRPGDLSTKIKEAQAQAQRYSSGALAGVELRGTRYLVMVSKSPHPMPADTVTNGIVYRHINVAVSGETPSAYAKRQVSGNSQK